MEEKKMTRKESYQAIRQIVMDAELEDKEELISFIDKQIEIIDNKAIKSKERAMKRKAQGDELRTSVKNVLTSDYQSADEIVLALNDEEITKAKVIARLSQLIKTGEVEKADAKVEGGRTIKVYRLAE